MFNRHAMFRNWRFRSCELAGHAFSRPARSGLRRKPAPKLTCHWILTDKNRLECRWRVERADGKAADEPDGRRQAQGITRLRPGRRISHNLLQTVGTWNDGVWHDAAGAMDLPLPRLRNTEISTAFD
jgi:hypothetical protein